MSLVEVIKKVTQKIAPGPAPSFKEAHVVKALELIGHNKNIGRIRLSKELELGEGATRTLLKHLKNEKVIQSSRSGISFTKAGNTLFSELSDKLSQEVQVPSSPLTLGSCNVAILLIPLQPKRPFLVKLVRSELSHRRHWQSHSI